MLGLAAGSLGLGPGDTRRDGFFDARLPESPRRRWSASRSSGRRQAVLRSSAPHILFLFLLLAGILLLTGASVAGIVSATREA